MASKVGGHNAGVSQGRQSSGAEHGLRLALHPLSVTVERFCSVPNHASTLFHRNSGFLILTLPCHAFAAIAILSLGGPLNGQLAIQVWRACSACTFGLGKAKSEASGRLLTVQRSVQTFATMWIINISKLSVTDNEYRAAKRLGSRYRFDLEEGSGDT
jgi:hypothetical protein